MTIINGIERTSRRVEIETTPEDVLNVLRIDLLAKHGIRRQDAYIDKNGSLICDNHDGGGGHSWVTEQVLMVAPPKTLTDGLRAINTLRFAFKT